QYGRGPEPQDLWLPPHPIPWRRAQPRAEPGVGCGARVKVGIQALGFAVLGLTPQAILRRPSGAFGTDSYGLFGPDDCGKEGSQAFQPDRVSESGWKAWPPGDSVLPR